MEALRGRKYQLIAVAAIAAVVAAGVVGTLADANKLLPERYHQHEKAQQLADLPEADRAAASGTNTDAATFASHLPVVSIDTGGQEIPGELVRDENGKTIEGEDGRAVVTAAPSGEPSITASLVAFDAESQDAVRANRLSDEPEIESSCLLRIRGNSSRAFDKKNYQITFVKSDGTDNDQEFLGMAKSETWTLHGPSLDKTLMRNYLAYGIAGEFMNDYVPDVRYCELFIDGEYQGLYLATETVKVEDGRLDLNPADPKSPTTSYVLGIDLTGSGPLTISDFLRYTLRLSKYMNIEYPNATTLTDEQKAWIEQDVSSFEKALFSYDYDIRDYGYANYIDVDSFVDSFVWNEFVINDDFAAYSTYLYKDVRGKLTLGPPWDFNNVFDNYRLATPTDKFYLVDRAWYFMLFKDEAFTERVISRYRELRAGALSEEHLNAYIDETTEYLGPVVERNFKVWGYLLDAENVSHAQKVEPDERNPRSFDEAIDQLKSFVTERGAWLDGSIEHLRQYSHESAVKKFNH